MPGRDRSYPAEFKAEAVELYRSSGKSIRDIAADDYRRCRVELPDEITTQIMGVGPHQDVNYMLDLDGNVAGTKTNAGEARASTRCR